MKTTDLTWLDRLLNKEHELKGFNSYQEYMLGYLHGYKDGIDNNPYEKDAQRFLYRNGYETGVTDYCIEAHPEGCNN